MRLPCLSVHTKYAEKPRHRIGGVGAQWRSPDKLNVCCANMVLNTCMCALTFTTGRRTGLGNLNGVNDPENAAYSSIRPRNNAQWRPPDKHNASLCEHGPQHMHVCPHLYDRGAH